jgi:predicted glycoside hydrolase/deacetylase ChbG (UPF0249 family)
MGPLDCRVNWNGKGNVVRRHKHGKRFLIVNADDFGRSAGINRGIIRAHEHGIVTSTSLMVRWPAARQAGEYARAHPELSVGLHFDLGEWACRSGGKWVQLYHVADENDRKAVLQQVRLQLETFRGLVARNPTHIDSHQHMHLSGPARSILADTARELGVPLRACSPKVDYRGDFYGQNENGWSFPEFISVASLIKVLEALREGWTELGCHPGLGRDLDSMYLDERKLEVKTLCDPRVRAAIVLNGIELRSYHDLDPDHSNRGKAKQPEITSTQYETTAARGKERYAKIIAR